MWLIFKNANFCEENASNNYQQSNSITISQRHSVFLNIIFFSLCIYVSTHVCMYVKRTMIIFICNCRKCMLQSSFVHKMLRNLGPAYLKFSSQHRFQKKVFIYRVFVVPAGLVSPTYICTYIHMYIHRNSQPHKKRELHSLFLFTDSLSSNFKYFWYLST
jgi:hypothetical protein